LNQFDRPARSRRLDRAEILTLNLFTVARAAAPGTGHRPEPLPAARLKKVHRRVRTAEFGTSNRTGRWAASGVLG